jgi:hypothetical protein
MRELIAKFIGFTNKFRVRIEEFIVLPRAYWFRRISGISGNIYRVIQKEIYIFKNVFYKYYWTCGDVLYID